MAEWKPISTERPIMWIFTKYGFLSAVCARLADGRHGQPIDRNRIRVRGRVRAHLDSVKARFPDLLGECEIQEFAGADYPVRLFVPKSVWMQIVSKLAEETDYDNFKSEVARHQDARAYERSLHDVWSVMRRLQK